MNLDPSIHMKAQDERELLAVVVPQKRSPNVPTFGPGEIRY